MDFRLSEASQHESTDELSETASVVSTPQGSNVSLPLRPTEQALKDTKHLTLSSRGDINTAAALRAQYAIDTPKPTRRRHKKMAAHVVNDDEDEPVIDHTAALPLHSKKTGRLERKQQKRSERLASQALQTTSLLSLPSELLTEILTYLTPTDVASLLLTSRSLYNLITANESSIARTIIQRRYWTLYRCFPLPIPFASVPVDAHAALLSPKRQELLNIHRKSYHQHVRMIDPNEICTCMTCVFAWNNLCLIVDLHHWQSHLEKREPIPIIDRGTNPEWNQKLLEGNATLVRQAMTRPLAYAHILQLHLDTITRTLLRNTRQRHKPPTNTAISPSSPSPSSSSTSDKPSVSSPDIPSGTAPPAASKTTTSKSAAKSAVSPPSNKPRLYRLTDADVETGTDEFLERSGPPSYDFPFMRDIYYSLEAYLPNRKWASEGQRWHYYALPPLQHERDLEWVRSWAVGVGFRGG